MVPDWTCPACGQSFLSRGQSHSCARQEMEALFEAYPAAIAVTRAVHRHLAGLGPVEMAATKTQVSFRHRIRFAWVWMPKQSAGSGPDVPVVSFGLRQRLGSERIWTSFLARRDVWTHHVLVPRAKDVDAQLKGWLREAFETVGAGAKGAA
jgi:hypothetical protein